MDDRNTGDRSVPTSGESTCLTGKRFGQYVQVTLRAQDTSIVAGVRPDRWGVASVTKKDIVKAISADVGMTQLQVKDIVQRTFDEIVQTLEREGKIELRNFGVFKVTKRAARPARNPRTNEEVRVPEKCVVTFKPGKEMQARIRRLNDVPTGSKDPETADAPEASESTATSWSSPAETAPPVSPISSTLPTISPGSPGAGHASTTHEAAGE